MKIDPYKHKEKYLNWKEKVKEKIPEISEQNSDLLLKYLQDMENGLNISNTNAKGSRGYPRLNNLKQRMIFLIKEFEKRYNLMNMAQTTEEQLHAFFAGMSNGTIQKQNGGCYKSTADYVKVFKAFWHWYQKINRKKGNKIEDITTDLDTRRTKPEWVYLNEHQIKILFDNAKPEYKVLIMFLFDTGIRSPTELINIKVSDLIQDCKELNIRDEVSKTFGRRIKLMLCSDLLREHIKAKNLQYDDYLFKISPPSVNQYLKRLAKRVFGDKESLAGQKYSDLTMYDFRHCSCCYWLPRYKSESALKFRFGWKKSDKIHYYSEMLGMRDTISDEDLLVDITKTEIEKQLLNSKKENEIMKERLRLLEKQMKTIAELMEQTANKGEMIFRLE
ncbi:MAG: site-specific integrase [Nanoarchaeota archaeon]|nr:site-specific integrase [Nanoarchaeota archaeon]